MTDWKRASEITEPGAYWIDDRRPNGKPSPSKKWTVAQVYQDLNGNGLYSLGSFLKNWPPNSYLYGPINPPERESK